MLARGEAGATLAALRAQQQQQQPAKILSLSQFEELYSHGGSSRETPTAHKNRIAMSSFAAALPPPPLQPQPGGGVFRGAVLVNGVSVPRAAPRSRSLPPSQRGASRPRSLPPALRRPEALPTPAAVRAAAACASMEAGRRRAKPRAVGLVRRGEGVRNEVGARGTSMERGRIAATASSSHDAMMANLAAWVGGLLSRSESNK